MQWRVAIIGLLGLMLVGGCWLWQNSLQRARQHEYDLKVLHTVRRLETAYRSNMAQGQQAEWFNIYAYLLYQTEHQAISPYEVDRELGYDSHHPCACETLNLGWVRFKDGVVVSGLTIFWERPQPELMVPFCMDVNGKAGPNQSGHDVFIGRLYNRKPNTRAIFDWHSTHYGCPENTYVPVAVALNRLQASR